MVEKKVSKKLQQAAEAYLDSIGSSREQLTHHQWAIIVNCVRSRRKVKPVVSVFLVLAAGLLCITFLYSRWTKREIAKAVPSRTIYFYKAGEKIAMPVSPREIRGYLESLARLAFNTGPSFILAVLLLLSVVVIPLQRRANRKMLEAFIPRKQNSEALGDKLGSDLQG